MRRLPGPWASLKDVSHTYHLYHAISQLLMTFDSTAETLANLYVLTAQEKRQDRDFKQVGPGSYAASMVDKKQEPKYR